jgi:PEP-CTERM motif
MMMKFSIPSLIGSKLVPAAVLAAALAGTGAHAANVSLSLVDTGSRSQAGTVAFHGDVNNSTATAKKTNIAIGSYQLSNGEWAYCLSPFTTAQSAASSYTPVTMASFFGVGGGYEQQFSLGSPNYLGLAPGYDNRDGMTVMNKIVALYNHAFADTKAASGNFSVAEKSAAFAYALWEVEGEGGAYSTTAGGLRLSGVNADVMAYATTLLDNLGSGNWAGWAYKTYEFAVFQANPITSSQSFLVVRDAPDNRTGIPEPSTLLLLAASGAALVVSRRKVAAKA